MKSLRKRWLSAASVTFFLLILFVGCKKNHDDNSLPLFNGFKIEKKKNPALAADVVFQISNDTLYGNLEYGLTDLVPTFIAPDASVDINGVAQTSAVTSVNFKDVVVYTLSFSDTRKKKYYVKINWERTAVHISITTDGNVPIVSKDNYVHASIKIDGKGMYDDYTGTTNIKGRGNSTWGMPKKPYRLKLDTKAGLLGLSPEKDWVLLANYLDETHMLNAIAMKAGKQFDTPFTNSIIPAEVTINGVYQGLYMFTEQVEAESNRVNVGNGGVLLELDTNFDEDWKFYSSSFSLPVMVKYPNLTMQSELDAIQAQFEQMELLVAAADFPNNNYLDYLDAESVARYFLVYMLTDNQEINHPKSTYIYKTATGKYTMGPIWDFDWAYGFEGTSLHFTSYTQPFFWAGNTSAGTQFFSKISTDPAIKQLLKQKWSAYKSEGLPVLLKFADDYAEIIKYAWIRDQAVWHTSTTGFKDQVGKLKTWLTNRADYLSSYIGNL